MDPGFTDPKSVAFPSPVHVGSEVQEVGKTPSIPSPVHYPSQSSAVAGSQPPQYIAQPTPHPAMAFDQLPQSISQPTPHPAMAFDQPQQPEQESQEPQYLVQHHDIRRSGCRCDGSNPCCFPCACFAGCCTAIFCCPCWTLCC